MWSLIYRATVYKTGVHAYSASLGISIMPSYIGFPCKLRKLPTRLEIPPGLKNMECMSNMNNWKLTPNDMNELGLIRFLSHSSLVAYLAKGIYPISSFSFRGNYSFLNFKILKISYTVFPRIVSAETILFWIYPYVLWPLITVHKCAETIQGRKLYEEIRYVGSLMYQT